MHYDENLSHLFSFGEDHILLDIHSGALHLLSPEAKCVVDFWRRTGCSLADLPEAWAQDRDAAIGAELGADARAEGAAKAYTHEAGADTYTAKTAAAADTEAATDATNASVPPTDISDADLLEIRDGLLELVEEGLLMSETPELAAYQLPQDYVVKALCLHIAHDCNLRCRYCFAGAGAFGGDRRLMSFETGQKAIDFLLEASGGRKHVEVDYFGGEPLMNFDVVRRLILYGEEASQRQAKVLKQTLTTNGVLLHGEILDFLNAHEVALVMSLDGRAEAHDRMRPTLDGRGSYHAVLPRLKAAVESRGGDNYYIRGTYTRHNMDFFQDVKHMVASGFDLVSVEPVVASPEEDYAIQAADLPTLFAQYEQLAQYYLEKERAGEPFSFFHFNLDLDQGPCLPKRLTGCGAGHEYLAVSPDGALYPCHQFVGIDAFRLGHVDGGIARPAIGQAFRASHVLTKEKCRSCWARFYCGGGCHANAWHFSGTLDEPYEIGCELEKKRLACAIWLITKMNDT